MSVAFGHLVWMKNGGGEDHRAAAFCTEFAPIPSPESDSKHSTNLGMRTLESMITKDGQRHGSNRINAPEKIPAPES